MTEIRLSGCTCEPLAGYLKAIGVLRLVAAQADPMARGRWVDDTFVLDTELTVDGLVHFFTERYVPTPIINPWNSGSGFGADDATKSKTAFEIVSLIRSSTDERLAAYRAAIDAGFLVAQHDRWGELDKGQQVSLCRAAFPDEAVDWVDAAVVITSESTAFPPLLGTGGNDGRLDFGSNFMQRLAKVIGLGKQALKQPDIEALVRDALLGTCVARLEAEPIGQFAPASAGGPSSAKDGAAKSLANPWDFVLLFEGAIGFASGVARRMGIGSSRTAMPFMVRGVAAAYGSAADENSRGEFWAPLWRHGAGAPEVLRLIAEGRAEYGGHQAQNAVDVARAMASLGVDRGIEEFVRFGFFERNGLATFCVPVGRLKVREQVRVGLLGDLDSWVNQVRRVSNMPASVRSLLRSIDERNLSITQNDAVETLQELLYDIHLLERRVANSAEIRKHVGPVRGLVAGRWVPLLNDGSFEFGVALALASFRPRGEAEGWIRQLTSSVSAYGKRPVVAGFGQRPLVAVLADCLVRISMQSQPSDGGSSKSAAWCGDSIAGACHPSHFASFATLAYEDDAVADVVLDRVERQLASLMLLDWRSGVAAPSGADDVARSLNEVPGEVALLKAVLHHRVGREGVYRRPMAPDPALPRWLAADQVSRSIESGLRSIRIAGCPPVATAASYAGRIAGPFLAAAALIPVSDQTAVRLLKRVAAVRDVSASNTPNTSNPEGEHE